MKKTSKKINNRKTRRIFRKKSIKNKKKIKGGGTCFKNLMSELKTTDSKNPHFKDSIIRKQNEINELVYKIQKIIDKKEDEQNILKDYNYRTISDEEKKDFYNIKNKNKITTTFNNDQCLYFFDDQKYYEYIKKKFLENENGLQNVYNIFKKNIEQAKIESKCLDECEACTDKDVEKQKCINETKSELEFQKKYDKGFLLRSSCKKKGYEIYEMCPRLKTLIKTNNAILSFFANKLKDEIREEKDEIREEKDEIREEDKLFKNYNKEKEVKFATEILTYILENKEYASKEDIFKFINNFLIYIDKKYIDKKYNENEYNDLLDIILNDYNNVDPNISEEYKKYKAHYEATGIHQKTKKEGF